MLYAQAKTNYLHQGNKSNHLLLKIILRRKQDVREAAVPPPPDI